MTNVVIGITGNIAAGKSTVSKIFSDRGYSVQDADKVVHDIYTIDKHAISQIAETFPEAVQNGIVSRSVLRGILKQNPKNRIVLESIVHPIVAHRRTDFIGSHKRAVLDVPLLFEVGIERMCDIVIVVDAPYEVRKNRVIKTRGVTEDIFELLNGVQMEQTEKCRRADIVINTNQPKVFTEKQVHELIDQIEEDFFDA